MSAGKLSGGGRGMMIFGSLFKTVKEASHCLISGVKCGCKNRTRVPGQVIFLLLYLKRKKQKKTKEVTDKVSPFYCLLWTKLSSLLYYLFFYLKFLSYVFKSLFFPLQLEATFCCGNWSILSNVFVYGFSFYLKQNHILQWHMLGLFLMTIDLNNLQSRNCIFLLSSPSETHLLVVNTQWRSWKYRDMYE